jgi:hypothetical protein
MKKSLLILCALVLVFVCTAEKGYPLVPPLLDIKRVELYFENNRPEITVAGDAQKLKAFAKITFQSAGLLEGHWEVDGRIISRVSEHLSTGNTVILETPDIPGLPTFDAGTHVVKFVITSSLARVFPLPSILYFVSVKDNATSPQPIELRAPNDKSSLAYIVPTFNWERFTAKTTYIIEFYKDQKSPPIFSACTMDTSYVVPQAVFWNLFPPGEQYYWRVKGSDSKTQGESPFREFGFKK